MSQSLRTCFMVALSVVLLTVCGCFESANHSSAPVQPIQGTIELAPNIAPKFSKTDVLYIIARTQQIGPPAAVKRIVNPAFPLKYSIGPEDAIAMGGAATSNAFIGNPNVTLAARLSKSGNAMPETGDLEGVFTENPAHMGQLGADIKIDRER